MTPDERLTALLGEHRQTHAGVCLCRWYSDTGHPHATGRQWEAHLAAVLTDAGLAWRDEAQAEALREAAQDVRASPSTRLGDLHPGTVWADWLQGRAEHLGGGDRG